MGVRAGAGRWVVRVVMGGWVNSRLALIHPFMYPCRGMYGACSVASQSGKQAGKQAALDVTETNFVRTIGPFFPGRGELKGAGVGPGSEWDGKVTRFAASE